MLQMFEDILNSRPVLLFTNERLAKKKEPHRQSLISTRLMPEFKANLMLDVCVKSTLGLIYCYKNLVLVGFYSSVQSSEASPSQHVFS